MAEYISRELVLDKATEVCYWCGYRDTYDEVVFRDDIEDIPVADVAPILHGRWIKQWCDNNMIGHEYEECSICGCSMLDTNQFWDSKFCPNCGARMDGDKYV